jgi:hypothetical protein
MASTLWALSIGLLLALGGGVFLKVRRAVERSEEREERIPNPESRRRDAPDRTGADGRRSRF